MGGIGPTQILIIVLILVLLFGAKKLPDAARSIGRSMRVFRSEVKEMKNESDQDEARESIVDGEIEAPKPAPAQPTDVTAGEEKRQENPR